MEAIGAFGQGLIDLEELHRVRPKQTRHIQRERVRERERDIYMYVYMNISLSLSLYIYIYIRIKTLNATNMNKDNKLRQSN